MCITGRFLNADRARHRSKFFFINQYQTMMNSDRDYISHHEVLEDLQFAKHMA